MFIDLLVHTFAWSEEVVGERQSDQAAQGQDEVREELTLAAERDVVSIIRTIQLKSTTDFLPAHRRYSLTTFCGEFRATAVAAAEYKDRVVQSRGSLRTG